MGRRCELQAFADAHGLDIVMVGETHLIVQASQDTICIGGTVKLKGVT